jgi:hypothetical protein
MFPIESAVLNKATKNSISAINAGMNVQEKRIKAIPVPILPA